MVDYFLKIDTVPGDSHDAHHRDEIDVISFSWGETHNSSPSMRTGAGSGRVQIEQKATGALGAAIHGGWDVKLNKKI